MRKIIVTEFISLDGVIEGPGPDDPFALAGWTLPYSGDEIATFKKDELFASSALLLGRATYEGFAKAWPGRTDEAGFADRMNSIPKYVVTSYLGEPAWNDSVALGTHFPQTLAEMKKEPIGDILVCGSSVLVQSLIQNRLVDEIRLLTYPVILRQGKKLFKDAQDGKIGLKLLETREFPKGVVLLRYGTDI